MGHANKVRLLGIAKSPTWYDERWTRRRYHGVSHHAWPTTVIRGWTWCQAGPRAARVNTQCVLCSQRTTDGHSDYAPRDPSQSIRRIFYGGGLLRQAHGTNN